MKPIDNDHPLYQLFHEHVARSFDYTDGLLREPDVETYMTHLLLTFVHTDQIFAIKDRTGRQLHSVADMIAEGDIRLNADSFAREREVHKHIGDFILFWSGIYPEFLQQIKLKFGQDLICDYLRQGRESYYVVSTFDYAPYDREANTFRKLSIRFEEYALCLRHLRETLPLHLGAGGSA
jgi:hypothetical protein